MEKSTGIGHTCHINKKAHPAFMREICKQRYFPGRVSRAHPSRPRDGDYLRLGMML